MDLHRKSGFDLWMYQPSPHGCALLQRNYRFFLSFVFVTTVYDLYIHAWCWVWLAHLSRSRGISFGDAIGFSYHGPCAMALICYTVLAFV